MSTRIFMKIKGHGHSLTLVQDHSDSTFSNFFSLETARAIEPKFHVELPWDGEMIVSPKDLCHTTRWPPCPYGKNL